MVPCSDRCPGSVEAPEDVASTLDVSTCSLKDIFVQTLDEKNVLSLCFFLCTSSNGVFKAKTDSMEHSQITFKELHRHSIYSDILQHIIGYEICE